MGEKSLDAALAEALGIVPCDDWETGNLGSAGGPVLWRNCDHEFGACFSTKTTPSTFGIVGGPPKFSTDGNAMLELVAVMQDRGWRVSFCGWERGTRVGATCHMVHKEFGLQGMDIEADSLPEAVALATRAALAALTNGETK